MNPAPRSFRLRFLGFYRANPLVPPSNLVTDMGFGAKGAEGDPKPQMFNQGIGYVPIPRHKSHRFVGGYDESLLKSALDVQAERLSDKRIRVSLVPKNITHAMPTGDLFRRLAVEVFPEENTPDKGKTKYLARHFIREPGMHEVADDRVHKTPRDIEFNVPPGPVRIRVRYERVGHLRADDEDQAEIESSVVLSEVRLSP